MTKIIFKQLKREKFAEFIFDMKECFSAEDLHREGSCFYFDIPKDIVKEILDSERLTDKLKEKIITLVKDNKQIDKKIVESMQKFWDENVNDLFFQEMERIMPQCSNSEYICHITDKMVGSYFEKGGEVVVDWVKEKDMEYHTSIVAEEILHLIYWKFWKQLFGKDISLDERFNIGEGYINGWSISEAIPDYLLIRNPKFEKFKWNNIDRAKGYKWLINVGKKLDPLWKNKKDFKDFIIKSHEICGFMR